MSRLFKSLPIVVALLIGCAKPLVPLVTEKPAYTVKLILAAESDLPPEDLVNHILKRTEQFCQESGEGHVARVVINYNAKERSTTVAYTCEKYAEKTTDYEKAKG